MAVAPPALGIEEQLVAGIRPYGTLGAQSAAQPVTVEVVSGLGKEAFRAQALLDGQPTVIQYGEFSPSEQAVAADKVVVDLPFLLSIIVAAQERDAWRSFPRHDGAASNLIETQAAGLRADAGMEDEFKLGLQRECEIKRMLRFDLGPQDRLDDGCVKDECTGSHLLVRPFKKLVVSSGAFQCQILAASRVRQSADRAPSPTVVPG